jgi:hypothetical protein
MGLYSAGPSQSAVSVVEHRTCACFNGQQTAFCFASLITHMRAVVATTTGRTTEHDLLSRSDAETSSAVNATRASDVFNRSISSATRCSATAASSGSTSGSSSTRNNLRYSMVMWTCSAVDGGVARPFINLTDADFAECGSTTGGPTCESLLPTTQAPITGSTDRPKPVVFRVKPDLGGRPGLLEHSQRVVDNIARRRSRFARFDVSKRRFADR